MTKIMEDIPPIQYQRGFAEFYKLKFLVDECVLIPRPETELLVEDVIKAQPQSVLEIGTGSGCIAVSIAKNLPNCKVTAVDISEDALTVAKKNAQIHQISAQIHFVQGDLLSKIRHPRKSEDLFEVDPLDTDSPFQGNDGYFSSHNRSFEFIVANLPYIPSSRIPTLDTSVKDFEPHLALDGGKDGFELYRRLFREMVSIKIFPRFFMGEIDSIHKEIAKKEAEKLFPKAKVEIKNDLTKRPRFISITF